MHVGCCVFVTQTMLKVYIAPLPLLERTEGDYALPKHSFLTVYYDSKGNIP